MNNFKSSNSSQKRSGLSAKSLVSLLGDGELDSLALGKGDVGLVALADDEHVVDPGGEGVTVGVLHVHDVEGSRVSLSGHDGSNSSGVPASSDHAEVAGIELDGVLDLAGGDIDLDRVVNPDDGVGVRGKLPRPWKRGVQDQWATMKKIV